MEDVDFKGKIEYWKNHVANAKAHPGGIGGYCRENGIKSSVYYSWRQVIKNEFAGEELVLPREVKRAKPSFIPVMIAESPDSEPQRVSKLPDARWVAEVMLHLLRGLP